MKKHYTAVFSQIRLGHSPGIRSPTPDMAGAGSVDLVRGSAMIMGPDRVGIISAFGNLVRPHATIRSAHACRHDSDVHESGYVIYGSPRELDDIREGLTRLLERLEERYEESLDAQRLGKMLHIGLQLNMPDRRGRLGEVSSFLAQKGGSIITLAAATRPPVNANVKGDRFVLRMKVEFPEKGVAPVMNWLRERHQIEGWDVRSQRLNEEWQCDGTVGLFF